MDMTTYRIAIVALGVGAVCCVVAVTILACLGREPPAVLSAIAGTFAGALAMAIQRPTRDSGHNANGVPPAPVRPGEGLHAPGATKTL